MTIGNFKFPVGTVCVVLCLLHLAMPTAELCRLYCTLMITKLNLLCAVSYT